MYQCINFKLVQFLFYSAAFDQRLAVTILRLKDGFDYSKLMGEEDHVHNGSDITLTTPSSILEIAKHPTSTMMHADSNLSLADLGKSETPKSKKKSRSTKS